MLNRRDLLNLVPASSLAWLWGAEAVPAASAYSARHRPVVRRPAGRAASDRRRIRGQLRGRAVGHRLGGTGLVARASRSACHPQSGRLGRCFRPGAGRASFPGRPVAPGRRVFYRVAVQPLSYQSAYKLQRGESVVGPVHSVTLPDSAAPRVRVAVVNDTHEHLPTVDALASRMEAIAPDVVVWNGDTCASAFDSPADLPRVLLKPGWAASRSLMFVPGNHDVRGASAPQIAGCLCTGPEPGLPYNVARRCGPLALLTLDTGEDKPDAHPVFAGTAAYEPYRRCQAAWLRDALCRPEIASAPFKVVFCHVPLRGLPNQNDGLRLEGYASWSGDGARAWMPVLREVRVSLIVSGHMHAWRSG